MANEIHKLFLCASLFLILALCNHNSNKFDVEEVECESGQEDKSRPTKCFQPNRWLMLFLYVFSSHEAEIDHSYQWCNQKTDGCG